MKELLIPIVFALILQAATYIIRLKLIDIHKFLRYQAEVSKWDRERFNALMKGDKKLLEKLEKRRKIIDQMRVYILRENMKVFIPTTILALILWELALKIVGDVEKAAFIPIIGKFISAKWWIIFCFFAISIITQKFIMPSPE